MPTNYVVAYHSKELDIQTKSNLQIACSANSISGSAIKNLGPTGEPLTICFKIGIWTHKGLNENQAEETHMGIDFLGPTRGPRKAQNDAIWHLYLHLHLLAENERDRRIVDFC